jgi:hypothetical protein
MRTNLFDQVLIASKGRSKSAFIRLREYLMAALFVKKLLNVKTHESMNIFYKCGTLENHFALEFR